MKFSVDGPHTIRVHRENGDRKYYGLINAAGESNLLYTIKRTLNMCDLHLIKTHMAQHGHLVDDMQQFVTTESRHGIFPTMHMWNTHWAIDGLEESWNRLGHTDLGIHFHIFTHDDKAPDLDEEAHRAAFIEALRGRALYQEQP
ncbi:MAG: hypothetical protein ACYC63_07840 [Armatimonadota bacterium]